MKIRFVHKILWGNDLDNMNMYHRLGDCYYFKFFTFQVIRSIFLAITLLHIFIMFYLDMKKSLFLIQDWKTALNFFAMMFVFAYSGRQRTQILIATKVYQTLKYPGRRYEDFETAEEFENDLKPYNSWKWVIILYELAATLSLFHTSIFWFRWYDDMIQYYEDRPPHTKSNIIVRIVMVH